MEPVIEDVNSEAIQLELQKLEALETRVLWARVITLIGGLVTSFWLIYQAYQRAGFLAAFVSFLALSLVYGFGVSPMFAIATSALCFYFKTVGLWLPIASYVLALILLYVDTRKGALRKRVDPYNLGSIYDK